MRRRDGRAGGGPQVVFVHGSMDRGAGMARTMSALPDLDVVRYDRRGYGGSEGVAEVCGIEGHVDDLLSVLDGRPSVVVGHSFGGIVGLTAATREPSVVLAVASFEAPMPWVPWWPGSTPGGAAAAAGGDGAAAAEGFLRRMLGDERWESLPGREKRLREGAALIAEITSVRSGDGPYDPDTVPVPVVSGRGTCSAAHLQRAAGELADRAPNAELVVIDGADHGAHLSHPVEFAAFARRAVDAAR